jgi:3-methyladenine DNA glycosylase AlkD
MTRGLLTTINSELRAVADPDRAAGAQAYMKSEMPFLGVAAGPLRKACRRVFADKAIPSAAAWRREVLAIWRNARFREERYAAIELTGARAYRAYQDLAALEMYEEMIVSREFFLRKAIGWALRQYAWTDPAEVRRYVRGHEDELSALSRREALKNIRT